MTPTSAQHPGARGYLNAATCGLPSLSALAAAQEHLAQWRDGAADVVAWDRPVRRSRALFATLAGVAVEAVSVGSQAAVTAAAVAASLAPGTRVGLVSGDFTSLTWPFLHRPDLRCTQVEPAELPGLDVDWVVASIVQSRDGRLLDTDALGGRRTLLDASQSAGWLPLDASAFDVVVTGAYKWLGCPRGTAFTTWSPWALANIPVLAPNWYAGRDVLASLYADSVDLSLDARRHDVSPAWACWPPTVPALEQLLTLGVEVVQAHDVSLAAAVRAALEVPETGSAIVSLDVPDGAVAALAAAGVRASGRGGRLRLAFHHWNDEDDVDRVVGALREHASGGRDPGSR